MTICIDFDYKCHVSDDGPMRGFDVPFFDGKCPTLTFTKRGELNVK
jgi:hypothetical protein